MRDRLGARGDAWGEFVELLAHYRLDKEDREKDEADQKKVAAAKHMRPIMPPPHAVPKGEAKRKKEKK